MSLIANTKKSVTDARVLFEMDVLLVNTQWINIGAGIYTVNFDNTYVYVDSSLLGGFTIQSFAYIGSVFVDGLPMTKTTALSILTTTDRIFYFDKAANSLYLRCINSDAPRLHTIHLGDVQGYSYHDFQPLGSEIPYEGRLKSIPTISKKRDPIYFGKLAYPSGTVSLQNGDGALDRFAADNNIYGSPARLLFGYADVQYDDYISFYRGMIGKVTIAEDTVSVSVADQRKQFTKPITYTCTNKNALEAIEEIFSANYSYDYSSTYYDTAAWAIAKALVGNISVTMYEEDTAINVIEAICKSVFGIFDLTGDGKFTFKVIDTSASAETTIRKADILNKFSIVYDPTEVISSIAVSFAVDLNPDSSTDRTWLIDQTRQSAIFIKYKIDNQKDFETWLVDEVAAAAFADRIMDYVQDVHGTFSITVPIKYYQLKIGSLVDVEINRQVKTWLGTTKCEVMGITYNLSAVTMDLSLRIV